MRDIHWLEQTETQVPEDDNWLSTAELRCLETMQVPKRRSEWRLGRWTAKRAAGFCLGFPGDFDSLTRLNIRPAASGMPELYIDDHPADASLSISHRCGVAISVLAMSKMKLGCDLELIEDHSNGFISDYFTDDERATIDAAPPQEHSSIVTLLWSAKESALKAMQVGLRVDTRSVSVRLPFQNSGHDLSRDGSASRGMRFLPEALDSWHPLAVDAGDDKTLDGWWQRSGRFVMTIVTCSAVGSLIRVGPIPASWSRAA